MNDNEIKKYIKVLDKYIIEDTEEEFKKIIIYDYLRKYGENNFDYFDEYLKITFALINYYKQQQSDNYLESEVN